MRYAYRPNHQTGRSGENGMTELRWAENARWRPQAGLFPDYGLEAAERVRRFHRTLPGYAPTPLVRMDALAAALGVKAVYVKDESKRFGLNAFKSLGGSYAIACLLAERLGRPLQDFASFEQLSDAAKRAFGALTFVTATDGNHGRGVAWAARQLGQRAVVYMPAGTREERLTNIRRLGADASITDLCYDDAVRLAARMAAENGWILIQDTTVKPNDPVVEHVMQGYTTMVLEAREQLCGAEPTHLILQAGVGSMAAAVSAFFCETCAAPPTVAVLEPLRADCLYRTAEADDGRLHAAPPPLESMMAGLCCGEVCAPSWAILQRDARIFVACGDEVAARGMRLLARPAGTDPVIVSGESGAAPAGLLDAVMREDACAPLRGAMGLGADSVVLLISTEGDTDRENYRRIVEG